MSEALRQRLAAQGVHSLLVQFTDIHGAARGKLVPLEHLNDVLTIGAGFSGPSIWGTGLARTGSRSEYYARGVPDTAHPLPWWPGVARIVGNGFVNGEPFDACPRHVLLRQVQRLSERGFTLQVGMEPEFFLLKKTGDAWVPFDDADQLDRPSYDLKSLPRQAPFLHALHEALKDAGMDVLQIDHEDAHGQYEVNFAHAQALVTADRLMFFKLAAHHYAEQQGAVFSMMPKPFADQPGSGLHCHVSLWAEGRNVFASPTALLSPTAHHFIAGVMHHAAALTALANPTVNSYKRLTVGESITGTTWAPAYIAQGFNNRTALIRTLPGRFEWRAPDASANPYLALASLIAAGLDGMDQQLALPAAQDDDLFNLSLAQIRKRDIALLPQSLGQALDALQADEVITKALGATLSHEFVALKRDEELQYRRHISAWERDRYAAAF
jgi:glutamine synthetase